MRRTNIYLDARQTQAADDLAARAGVSRAEIIRRLIDRGLSGGPTRDELSAVIDESFGVLGEIDVTLRGATSRDVHLEEMARR